MKADHEGEVFNIGGRSNISVNETIKILEKSIKKKAKWSEPLKLDTLG